MTSPVAPLLIDRVIVNHTDFTSARQCYESILGTGE